MDETYIKVGGQLKYLYRAVDRAGATIDFLLRAHRDLDAARRFFERAIELHGVPETITIDKSGADTAAIEGLRADSGADIQLRQSKYLHNIVEQDHREIKRIVRPMLGFKSFRCASILLAGIETMHMIKKGQFDRRIAVLLAGLLIVGRSPAPFGLTPLLRQNPMLCLLV